MYKPKYMTYTSHEKVEESLSYCWMGVNANIINLKGGIINGTLRPSRVPKRGERQTISVIIRIKIELLNYYC